MNFHDDFLSSSKSPSNPVNTGIREERNPEDHARRVVGDEGSPEYNGDYYSSRDAQGGRALRAPPGRITCILEK